MSLLPRTPRNLGRMVLVLVMLVTVSIAYAAPASAANLHCYGNGGPSAVWYTFTHGHGGKNWIVPPSQSGNRVVRTNGTTNVEPWNQWLLVCNDKDYGWGYVRLLANATGQWLGYDFGVDGYPISADFGENSGDGLFYLCDYDGNFLQLRQVGSNWWAGRSGDDNYLVADDVNGGHTLFTTSPRLNPYMPYCPR